MIASTVMHGIGQSMFHLPLPVLEKVLRPAIVYVVLVVFLRLFGKRELAQLNPFDLVVLLSLSNTVQNAIIGEDNSVTGGVIGAFALLTINWLVMWLLYRTPAMNKAMEGEPATLIRDGKVDVAACKRERLTREELITALNRNGFNEPEDVALCVLEPNGTFFVKGKSPSGDDQDQAALMAAVGKLTAEVAGMRAQLGLQGGSGI